MSRLKHKVFARNNDRPPFTFPWKRFWALRANYPQGKWHATKQYLFPYTLDAKAASVLHDSRSTATGDKLALFASFSYDDSVQEYVFYYLEQLKRTGCDVVFCSTSASINPESLRRLKEVCTLVIHRENKAFDFGSYYVAWKHVENPEKYKYILLANDSAYGPLFDLSEYFSKFENSQYDMFGITDSFDTYYHIQSYFVGFKVSDRTLGFLRYFWDQHYVPYDVQRLNIESYEFGLTQLGLWKGLRIGALCPFPRTREVMVQMLEEIGYLSHLVNHMLSQAHYFWRPLFERLRCPFIKTDLVDHNAVGLPDTNRMLPVMAAAGYPTELVLKNLAQKGLSDSHLR